ncbi:putative ribonuclease H-like domain-containing protein [Tanacetum coccineum]
MDYINLLELGMKPCQLICWTMGFREERRPTCFIIKENGDILLVQVYVDDIIFGSTKKSLCNAFEKLMHEKFQMSSMGELTFFLGLKMKQKNDGIFISQDKYVAEILKKFGFTFVKTASTPMETQKPLLKDEDGEELDVHLYRSIIDSLMYLTSSRPDIMFAVCACPRYQVNPKVSHLHAVKRIFRYLKGQPKLCLWYLKYSPFDLVAYTDSDYAGASLDRKSTTGGCQFLGCRLILWQCKKQTVVANSTTEAEYNGIGVNAGDSKLMLLGINLLLLGKVNVARHKLTAAGERFEQIVDFLNAHTIKYALTVNPTIYTSCIEQFWATVKVKTINGEVQLQALVDGKKIIVTEASVRRDLQLNDEEGTNYLPNATIFEELTRMGYEKLSQKLTFYKAFFSPQWKFLIHTILKCLSAKTTAWNEFSSTMASAIICLATNQKFNYSKYIFESMVKNLDNAGKFLMYPRVGKGFSRRETPLFPTMVVQNQADMGEDEAVNEEMDDNLERAATTATSLDADSLGTSSGGGPRRQETMGDTIAHTRSENVSKLSNDPLLARGNTLQSCKDRLKLLELMELCTNLQNRVIDLENTKTAQAQEITSLKLRVKKLEKKGGSRTHKLKRLYKGRKIDDIDKDAEITLVDETQGRYGDDIMFDVSDLAGKEVFVTEQGVPDGKKDDDAQVNTAATTVSTASTIPVSVALITVVEITLAQALA